MKNVLAKILSAGIYFALICICSSAYAEEENISIYDLKDQWLDVSGKPVTIGIGRGSWVLMAMVYTSCPNACPMTISKLKTIESSLSKSNSTKVKIVLASFDPKNDLPKKLAKYAQTRGLDPQKWIFLSPPNDHVARTLAVALGINYKSLGDGDFSHSNIITLVDPKGVAVAKMESLTAPVDPILNALNGIQSKGETGK